MFKRLISLLLFLPFLGFAQNANLLTYQQAIEHALKNNFEIQISKNNLTAAELQNNLGSAGFLPKVDLMANGSLSNNNTKQEFSSGLLVDKKGVASNNINSGAFLSWTIFDGMKMFANRERLNLMEQQGELSLKIQIENTLEKVTINYYQVVKQEQLINGIKAAMKVSEERIILAKKKLELGSGSNVELLQAKMDLNAQKSNLINQKNTLNDYKTELLALIKPESNNPFSVDSVFVFESLSAIEDIKQKVEKQNNSILFSQKKALITSQNIKEIRAQALPKFGLTSNYIFGKTENSAGFALLNQNLGYNLGFTFSWNIFNGFNTNNQLKVSQLQFQNNRLEEENTKTLRLLEVATNYNRFLGDKEALDLEEENIKLAEQSLKISSERLRLGLGNYLEIKESQSSYEDAITRLVNARFNLKKSEITLKKLAGELIK